MVIYKTTNLVTGKIYVGQDCNDNPKYLGSGVILKRSIRKHGRINFKKETLELCDMSNIDDREKYWIRKLDTRNPIVGYNIAIGGEGAARGEGNPWFGKVGPRQGCHISEEMKKKLRDAHVGKKLSEECKRKMSMVRKGKKHRKYSIESCKKMSDLMKKRIASGSWKNPCPPSGWKHTAEAKEKIGKRFRGTKLSEEHKAKVGIAHKKENLSEETIKKRLESCRAYWKLVKMGIVEDKRYKIKDNKGGCNGN